MYIMYFTLFFIWWNQGSEALFNLAESFRVQNEYQCFSKDFYDILAKAEFMALFSVVIAS